MIKTKKSRRKANKVLILLLIALSNLNCATTLAKDLKKADTAVAANGSTESKATSNSVETNEIDKDDKNEENNEVSEDIKLKRWKEISREVLRSNRDMDKKLVDEKFAGGLSEELYDKLNEHKISDRQSLVEGLKYAKTFKECREILNDFENIEIIGYKCNYIPQTFICAKEKKCGFNFSLWLEKDTKNDMPTFDYIYVPGSPPYRLLRGNELLHSMEHISTLYSNIFSPNCFYPDEVALGTAATTPDNNVQYYSLTPPYNSLSWFKSQISWFDRLKNLDKDKIKRILACERKRIYDENLNFNRRNCEGKKYVDSAGDLLVGELLDLRGLDYKLYSDNVYILREITDEEILETFKEVVHPSNMCAGLTTPNKLGDIFNFLWTIKKYCEGYNRAKSLYLKTRKQRREYVNNYFYKDKWKNVKERYIRKSFDAGRFPNLFTNYDNDGKVIGSFKFVSTFIVNLDNFGFEKITSQIRDLCCFHSDVIEQVLGKEKIKELTGFESIEIQPWHYSLEDVHRAFYTCGVWSDELILTIRGNDESSFSKGNLANNVHRLLSTVVEKVSKMSDDEFFKLNVLSDLPPSRFKDHCKHSLSAAVLKSYDGDRFNISEVLPIEDGNVHLTKDIFREGVIKNRHLLNSFSRPFNSYTAYVAVKMEGTNPPKKPVYYRGNDVIGTCNTFKIPIQFNCFDNELGFVTKYIVSQFLTHIIKEKGWSYSTCLNNYTNCSLKIKPVKDYLESGDSEVNVNFLKRRFDDGTVKKLYNNFLEIGLSDLVYGNFSIDEFIELVKSKFINYLKRSLARLYGAYEENIKAIEKINSVKNFDSLPEEFMWDTAMSCPPLSFVESMPIPNISKKYKKFIKNYKEFDKTVDKKIKELNNKYKDRYKEGAPISMVKDYRKEKILFRKEMFPETQEYLKEFRDILVDEVELYKNSPDLGVEDIKQSLRENVEFKKFKDVNVSEKENKSEGNAKSTS